jgi:dihydrofolate synthase/folylpolyglutamate synthase
MFVIDAERKRSPVLPNSSDRPVPGQPEMYLTPGLLGEIVYGSHRRVSHQLHGLDRETRTLKPTVALFRALGIDFGRWPRVNVTGSKGKGSVSTMIAALLQAAGEQVGLVTSPHLRHFNERIRLNGRCVSDAELDDAVKRIAPVVMELTEALQPPSYLGPSGVILALAATIFARKGVTAVVIEAGRGGEFDESRLIDADLSVLTPIMYEHADKLGDTVEAIAETKARISAPGAGVLSARQEPEVRAAITRDVRARSGDMTFVDDVTEASAVVSDGAGTHFDLRVGRTAYSSLFMPLLGAHQVENAALALAAVNRLLGRPIEEEAARSGFRSLRLFGRSMVLCDHPPMILDGAINAESARATVDLARRLTDTGSIAVIAVPKPKDLAGVCREVASIAGRIIVTEVDTPTLTWYPDAAEIAREYCPFVTRIPDFIAAVEAAIGEAGDERGLLLLGTQSFVGAALEYFQVDTCVIYDG